jgi:hypothetical protein
MLFGCCTQNLTKTIMEWVCINCRGRPNVT